ncbi:MAG: hypothetical protein GPW18_01485 [Euryarchaeota archaeon]|nr:hypothetical protein [Euryarchaeota archaeon]
MGYVKVWDPDGIFYHYEITGKGGNENMNEELEKLIEQWEQEEKKLRNKIKQEKDEDKRNYLKKKLSDAIKIKEKLRDRLWREL